jgi:SHAQKYF class myb-like DNA-binding protein
MQLKKKETIMNPKIAPYSNFINSTEEKILNQDNGKKPEQQNRIQKATNAILADAEENKNFNSSEKIENSSKTLKPYLSRYWQKDEHKRYLEGVEKYGPKDVESIAAHVGTRTKIQVRTHHQKYLLKLEREKLSGISQQLFLRSAEKPTAARPLQEIKESQKIQPSVQVSIHIPIALWVQPQQQPRAQQVYRPQQMPHLAPQQMPRLAPQQMPQQIQQNIQYQMKRPSNPKTENILHKQQQRKQKIQNSRQRKQQMEKIQEQLQSIKMKELTYPQMDPKSQKRMFDQIEQIHQEMERHIRREWKEIDREMPTSGDK